jgi:putative peptidoglycan lipid II flippase
LKPSAPGAPGARVAPEDGPGSLARSTAIMSMGTVLSRVTGVVRLAALAAALGITETRLTDSYNLANTAPNIIYELVLGGVITSVFVPLFVELRQTESRERAWEVFSAMLNVSLLVLAAIALAGVSAAPWIARFYASRLSGAELAAQQRVITFWLRLFIPQVVLYGLYFITAGLLNAHKRFGPAMYTPILNNIVLIGVFLVFHRLYGAVSLATVTTTQLWIIGLGTTASVAPMGVALLPFLRGLGRYRLTLSLAHPAVRKLARLSVFVVGFVVANQLGYVVIQWLANAEQGGYSAYISASTFFLMPVGLVVWSLSSALLPSLSEHALAEEWDGYRRLLSAGLRAILFLMLPCAFGLFVLAEPIVRILLEHGVTTATSTEVVAAVLRYLVLGLVQFSLFQVLVRSLYALQDTKTPFSINCFVVALNTAVNIPMFAWLGVRGLAAGQAAAYSLGVVLLARALARRVGGVEGRRIAAAGARVAAAAAGMAVVVAVVWTLVEPLAAGGLGAQALALGVAIGLGGATYLGLAHLLGVEELAHLRGIVARRADGPPPMPT